MASQVLSPSRSLDGKVAIVTGASRGIGEVLAFDLASRGAKVAITFTSDKSKSAAEGLASRISSEAKSSAITIQCDLLEVPSADKIVQETIKAFGQIDIVVNNAGMAHVKSIGEISAEEFNTVYNLNVRAPFLLVQAALPHLRRPGRIINISSVGGRAAFPQTGIYTSSKAALEGLTRAWAVDLGKDGTTANAVLPGPVQSEMLESVPKEIINGQKAATPVENRIGTAQEVAGIVSFLAEERSRWVTGQCISASGGYLMF